MPNTDDYLQSRLAVVETKVTGVENRLDAHSERQEKILERVETLSVEMGKVTSTLPLIQHSLQRLENGKATKGNGAITTKVGILWMLLIVALTAVATKGVSLLLAP